MSNRVKIETLCSACRAPLPTIRITEKRLSRTLKYPVLDGKQVAVIQGRPQHKGCAK